MARSIEVVLELDNKQYNRSIKQSQKQTKDFETSGVSSANNLRNAFIALGGAAVIKSIVDVGATFQQLENSLNVVFGSVDAGAAAFERVQQFATKTQFDVQTLTQAFVQLKGAGVEPTEELLMTFADTASVTTDQMGTFQAALDLVSRSTAGGLGLEDLNRLADRGIPVFTILQEKLGLARLEVSEFGKTAAGADKVISALLEGMREGFGGALANQAGLINFELGNLKIAMDNLKLALFETFGDDAAQGIKALADAINNLAENTDAIVSLMKVLGGLLSVFLAFGAVKGVTSMMNGLEKGLKGLLATAAGSGKRFKGLKEAIRGLGLKSASSKLDGFNKSLGKTNPTLLKSAKNTLTFSGGLATAARTLLRFAGFVGIAFTAFEALRFAFNLFKDPADDVADSVDGISGAMKRNEEAQKAFEERQKAAAESAKELAAEITDLKSVATSFLANDYRSELEKITDRQDKARQALFDLRMAFVKSNGDIENYQALLAAVKNEIIAADAAFSDYNESLKDPAQETFLEFVKRMDDALLNYNTEQKNATQLLEEMNEALALGHGDAEAFAFVIERLNSILGITTPNLEEGRRAFADFAESLEGVFLTTVEYERIQKQLNALIEKYPELAKEAKEAQEDLDAALSSNEGVTNFLNTLGQAQKSLSEDLAQAFMDGESAGDAFQKFFKKMVKQIIADIIRLAIIQPILNAIMAPFGFGMGSGGNVIKLPGKASGGPVMPGGTYLVGEKGPELLHMGGAAGTITPNSQMGGGQVTYNINAVDAPSFQALVASDPGFIYAVTQAGARTIPGAR